MPKHKYPNHWPEGWLNAYNFTPELQEPYYIPVKSILDDYPCCEKPQHEGWVLAGTIGFEPVFFVHVLCRSCKNGFYLQSSFGIEFKAPPEIKYDIMITTLGVCTMFAVTYGGYTPPTIEHIS